MRSQQPFGAVCALLCSLMPGFGGALASPLTPHANRLDLVTSDFELGVGDTAAALIAASLSERVARPAAIDPRTLPKDVPGGVSTTRLIVRFAAGVRLSATGSVEHEDSVATGVDSVKFQTLRDVLRTWGVTAATPALSIEPRNAALATGLGLDRYWVLSVPAGTDTPTMAEQLATTAWPLVEAAEVDSLPVLHQNEPIDALWPQQWATRNTGQVMSGTPGTVDADADILEAWDFSRGSEAVVIAVLDTGVSLSHPDVLPNRLAGRNFTTANTTETDDNGTLSHGTHVSGIIAAAANEFGVIGVAPLCKVLPVKVATASFGSETWTANGLVWATDQGARIVNMSLGHSTGGTFLNNAVVYAAASDVLMCSSTGNIPGSPIGAPARWEPVIAIGATDHRDQCAAFTTGGPEMDIAAPGVDILSAWDASGNFNGYQMQSGTSMACPMVAGTAGLLLSVNPSLSSMEVRNLIIRTAEDRGPTGWDSCFGWGRLNTRYAVLAAQGTLPPCYADWNGDYLVSTSDVFDFLGDWLNGDADFNENGVTETQDLFDFLESFSTGC